ncbi:caspase recruitment domain-containing protein 6 isoform X2 [Nannospalax galili]|uniref:caspase recruitment domain-containing protein 6 isoform X2 n=1 Tax=Nannospalax galili TaxID=1026970 RepID=UPI00111C4A8D|nr:caspase recruitment domain-containing protein 6 isoform X2 [Nannospalax galili]
MAAVCTSSEIIAIKRTRLLQILQQDPDSVLDTLTSQRLISEEEHETLEKVTDPLKKSRKLLILVQKKGEVSCECFLKCLFSMFPESATTLDLKHVLQLENIAPPQSMGVSKNSEDTFSLGKKTPENPEITKFSEEKECLDLETSEFFQDKESSYREALLPSRGSKREVTMPYSVDRVEYEIPATITYLKDGERYEEPDDSLYLGQEEYQQSSGYPDDIETIVEEGACDDQQYVLDDGEEEPEYSETTEYSSEEKSYEDSETSISLEEEEKRMEERKKIFQHVLSCLSMDRSRKLLPDFVKQFSLDRGCKWMPKTPGDLAWNFLLKVQALDLTARDFILQHRALDEDDKEELLTRMETLEIEDIQTINPLDVLCACMLCSDSSLQREVMSNMYRCQFALPLLLPDAENNKSILMLGAMRDVKKPAAPSSGRPPTDTDKFLSLMKMPFISFVRLGHFSFSKSRILNTLLNRTQWKSHKIFLHKDFSIPVLPRQISDGLVEITWYFPDSDVLKESPHFFQKPVAVANLRGDIERFWTQFGFLVEISSAVFFFTDYISEKEWDLLMFLGEDVIERCYFVLSPQAKESEEAQIFQRILKLRPSQLLFWEGEEAGDRRKNLEALQAALQEAMSSSLRCVSIEEMASLARELGIQVDQDFEITQGIQVSPGTAEDENQQRHSWTSESHSQLPAREPGAQGEGNQSAQNFHQTPVLMPHLVHPWPLPIKVESNFYNASFKAPWVMGTHLGSVQRAKWFCPLPLQNPGVHSTNKTFGLQYFQPQRFYSGERFLKFSRPFWGHRLNRAYGRSQRPTSQHVWTCPERLQTVGAPQRSGAVVSHVGHLYSLGSQIGRTVGKPQPGNTQAPGTQLTGKVMRTSHVKHPYPQSFQPTGSIEEKQRPAFHQRAQMMSHKMPSDPAFQPRSQSMSGSKLSPSSQFNPHQPKSQGKHFQHKPFQPVPYQTKPTPPQPSQAKPSPSKPTHPQPFQAKPSSSKPTQPQSHRPHQPQSKPSQTRPTQPTSSQSKPSQAKIYHPRAGPKRTGKH